MVPAIVQISQDQSITPPNTRIAGQTMADAMRAGRHYQPNTAPNKIMVGITLTC